MMPILSSLPSLALALDDLALGMLLLELDLLAGELVDALFLGAVGLNDRAGPWSRAGRGYSGRHR